MLLYSIVANTLQYSYITHTDYTQYIHTFNHDQARPQAVCNICLVIVFVKGVKFAHALYLQCTQ